MSGQHAILAPSSAHIRAKCPGSRALSELYPETEESEESKEGTAAHWAAAELLEGRQIDVGLIAPNGVMITDEMVEGADMYVAEIRSSDAEFVGFSVHVEERVEIDTIHTLCWGTPDAWRFKPTRLKVWDYKFGHRYVDVFENEQLIEYAAGILKKVGINGITDGFTDVDFTIVQPRCYVGGAPIRRWTVKAVDLRGYFNKMRMVEEAAMKPDAPTVVNEHCRDCAGRHACRASQRAAYDAMALADTNIPFNLSNEALGAELRFIDKAIANLQARQTGLAEQATALLRSGKQVPFYKLEQSYGRERWSVPDAQMLALGQMLNLPLSVPKLITPKQAIKAGLDPNLAAAYYETPRGELKLKPDDGSQARKIFGAIS